jgi:hypothetical protein
MFRTACFLANRCGLSRDDARVYLKYYSETRSDPRWSDKEIEQKLDDAYGPEHYNPIGVFGNSQRTKALQTMRQAARKHLASNLNASLTAIKRPSLCPRSQVAMMDRFPCHKSGCPH